MTDEVFRLQFGLPPEKAKRLMQRVVEIVNREVHNVIENANYYIEPREYGYGGELYKDDEDADGYTCLYDYEEQESPESRFMELISYDTFFGGHGSACEACKFLGIEEKSGDM